ncbi:archaellin/type IV pilin N-terminal domain-containing protein [Candidatus Nitrosotenuis sp. DW1]|uniref:archaellin/type IV pilin N-terminal domain-containing protein n=1 Tax=Candidatus Nitrosotenuis sp. DW1 TaxID=2259672 RepID=UPI0015CB3BC5|nr:archaellin/type IV pilin N-terminal domain-containing protein [Candidatus Nitrosotenuis sp. DW1]QLH08187.1 flagellin [Candidatus Nitrosotenuis sp. DW1]
MKLVRREHSRSHRGVIGVESAIVMIAFVIVAAALAFVVLNMGFSTTQRAKTAIVSSLEESSSALEIAGKVTASGDVSPTGKINVTSIPVKVASGGSSVNLGNTTMAVKYFSGSVEYDNIMTGILSTGTYANLTVAMQAAAQAGHLNVNPITSNTAADATAAVIYFAVNRNDNAILDQGEHAIIAIVHKGSERPQALDMIKAEIIVPTGSPLTVERLVPNITTNVVDLG